MSSTERVLKPPTDRQFEVLDLVEQGFDNRKIAEKLHISEFTVKDQIRRMLKRYGPFPDKRTLLVKHIRAQGWYRGKLPPIQRAA